MEPKDPRLETLRLLTSIDVTLKQILSAVSRSAGPAATGPRLAPDSDLDSKFGDEVVKFNPRDWSGTTFKDSHMSECSPEFLDMLAESYDAFAEKNIGIMTTAGKPKSEFDRRSARRARGWAARIRKNGTPPKPETSASMPGWNEPQTEWSDGGEGF